MTPRERDARRAVWQRLAEAGVIPPPEVWAQLVAEEERRLARETSA